MKQLLSLVLSVLILVLVVGSVSQAQSSLAAAHGFRSDAEMANYLTVASSRVVEVPLTAQQLQQYSAMPVVLPDAVLLGNDLISALGPVLADPSGVTGWLTLGQKVWDVVVANKPVVNIQTARISVLPNDKASWAQMSGWQRPYARSFSYVATNLFGLDVVTQTYTLTFNYGGEVNGKGAFLANATIIPSNIDVMWGYELDSSVEVGQIVNTGTVENPVPGVELQLKRTIKTLLKDDTSTDSYFIQGNGTMKQATL